MEKPVHKLILEVGITPRGELAFMFSPGAQEQLERQGLIAIIGEGLASFGEQLRMKGLNITKKGPAVLYGPGGKPIA